jgi:hypothetical protein
MITLDILHDQKVPVARAVTDVEGGHHVHVADPGREAGLVQEHADELLFVREVRMQHLDCHQSLEPRNALSAGNVYGRHPTRGQLRQDLVTTELPTRHGAGHPIAS